MTIELNKQPSKRMLSKKLNIITFIKAEAIAKLLYETALMFLIN